MQDINKTMLGVKIERNILCLAFIEILVRCLVLYLNRTINNQILQTCMIQNANNLLIKREKD